MKSLLSILICLLFAPNEPQKRGLDEINFTYSTYFVRDTVYFATSSEPFGGDCSYKLALDSIKGQECYISGKYEGDAKCYGDCAIDTVRLGVLPDGEYTLHYSFVDKAGWYETETFSANFSVSPQSIQTTERLEDLTVRKEGENGISFALKNKNTDALQLYIFDVNGRENRIYPMEKDVITVNDLAPGIYLYSLKNRNETLYKGKFIIGQ